jgi:hypothetical protein
VVFDGVSMGIMSFAFGVFDMAKHYGVLPEATRLPVEEVARRCGFSSSAALRQHFRRVTGTAPAAYRATFGPRLETRAVLRALS